MISSLTRFFRPPASRDAFAELAERYRGRLRQSQGRALPPKKAVKVGVVVSPWQQTAVPFYLIEWAIQLRREGLDVEFVWEVWPNAAASATAEEREIVRTLKLAKALFGIGTVKPSRRRTPIRHDSLRLRQLAFESVTRTLGREPSAGNADVSVEEQRLRMHAGNVEKLLTARRYAWILLPGGVWSASGIYWDACMRLGIGLTTFDSGPGLLCFQHGGPAAHFPDLESGMRMLAEACAQDEAVRVHVENWVENRLSVRKSGEDDFRLQPQAASPFGKPVDIVVPLNYRLDTAAMCRQRLFASINEWLAALVDWARKHPHVSIAVRQHPCEKIPAFKSGEDYSWISGPNLHFIPAEAEINTYDLLSRCKLVLPYSSRVGIEAAILGKPVVLAAHAYYENMSFAKRPATREAYFEQIQTSLLQGGLDSAERLLACAAYYVAENFGLYKTQFTPIPSDFEMWVRQSPDELWASGQNQIFVRAAVTRKAAAELLVADAIQSIRSHPSDKVSTFPAGT
jgi:hypothetical protein